jgi:4-aminobutyrate aminotransferase-like enzyme
LTLFPRWVEATGSWVLDADGRRLLDLTGGFGVAALGHRNPDVAAAIESQAARCAHALGDLAEADVTGRLRERLGSELGGREVILGVTGEDAVEVALRTALLVTGKSGIVAFDGAYHGTGLLALAATAFERFRRPFAAWLPGPVHRFPYGEDPGALPADAGCVVVEPVQGRGGARVPPEGFLELLRERCEEAGALLVVDEIYTGLGRTGETWAGDELGDVVTCGKALGGGLPLSACLVRPEYAGVWELGPEDVYTHTHTGNPLACAAALVVLERVPALLPRVRAAGERFADAGWHGAGLLRARSGDAEEAYRRGVIVVPAGEDGSLVSATPALTIGDEEIDYALDRLA